MKRDLFVLLLLGIGALTVLPGCKRATAPVSAIGRCAVDPRDGFSYGKIVAEETDMTSGEKKYKIQGEGGVSWSKKAANVKVVDCP